MNYQNAQSYILIPIKIGNAPVNIYVQSQAITGFWMDPANTDQSIVYFNGIGQFTVLMAFDLLKNLILVPKGGA